MRVRVLLARRALRPADEPEAVHEPALRRTGKDGPDPAEVHALRQAFLQASIVKTCASADRRQQITGLPSAAGIIIAYISFRVVVGRQQASRRRGPSHSCSYARDAGPSSKLLRIMGMGRVSRSREATVRRTPSWRPLGLGDLHMRTSMISSRLFSNSSRKRIAAAPRRRGARVPGPPRPRSPRQRQLAAVASSARRPRTLAADLSSPGLVTSATRP